MYCMKHIYTFQDLLLIGITGEELDIAGDGKFDSQGNNIQTVHLKKIYLW